MFYQELAVQQAHLRDRLQSQTEEQIARLETLVSDRQRTALEQLQQGEAEIQRLSAGLGDRLPGPLRAMGRGLQIR